MKVGNFRKLLEGLPDDAELVLSKDEEGNDFSPVSDITEGMYYSTETWYGEFFAMGDLDEDEQEEKDVGVQAFCIWPVN